MHTPNKRERALAAILLVAAPFVAIAIILWMASESARKVFGELAATPVSEFWNETKDLYRGLWSVTTGKPWWN